MISSDDAPDDLRDTLMSSYEEAESALPKDEPLVESPVSDQTAPGEVATDALPEQAASPTPKKTDHPTDPTRYSDGSFKPQKAAPEKAAPETPPSKDTKTEASTAVPPTVAPPRSWTAAEKTEWSKLSPAIQTAVSRRDAEIDNVGKQWSDQKRRYEEILAPIAESARARGIGVEQGTQMLIAAQRALDTDPINAIRHIARSYGVDLATLAGTQAANGSPEQFQQPAAYRDPRIDQLYNAHVMQEQQRSQQTVDLVTTFATSPGHEHFDAVEAELMAMIPTIKSINPTWGHDKVLQEAYDRATFANPTTRQSILDARAAEQEAKRVEAAKQRSNAARRASTSVTGAPSGTPATQAKDTLRAELEAAFAGT